MSIQVEPTAEQVAYRALVAHYKQNIKDASVAIRVTKREISDTQKANGSGSAASMQSRLTSDRVQQRARLLIYGALRGRTWDQIENKHAEINPRLKYWITKVWNDTPAPVPMPEWLKEIA